MKFYIDLASRRFIKAPNSPVPLQRVFFKRRDIIDVEVIFVDRSAVVPTPAGTTLQTALKRSFSDPQFLAAADPDGTLNLYTVPVEELFPGNTASASALLEVKYTRPGEETRTATLAVELQNSVILGTEGTPVAVPDLKATLDDAETGTDNTKWMTPLRVWDAIRKAATAAVTWANLPGKPSTFPPEAHTHTVADVTGLQASLDAKQPAGSYATSAQGAKADSAVQPSALTPYRTATAQDAIDAGKASTTHTHTASQISDFAAAVAAVAPGGGPAGALIISKTYGELKALKDANQLVPGQWYKITDFQLKWWNQSKNDVRIMTSSEVEPLNVFAIKSNEFAINAYSDLYPTDIIYYGFSANPLATPGSNYSTIPNAHGWISRRISDGSSSVDAPYDWRHITWNCCRLDLSSFPEWSPIANYNRREIVKYNDKLFISFYSGNTNNVPDGARFDGNGDISDSTNIYWWAAVSPFVEGLTYFPTNELDETAFKLILPSKVNFKLPYDENSTPPVPKYSPSYGLPQQNTWSINNYYPNQSDYVTIPWSQDRTQKPTFARNPTAIDSQNYFSGPVKMGAECIGNVFYKRASSVEFETNCKFNVFAGETYFLVAGNYFSFNRVGFSCYNNRFGNSCFNNSLGNGSTRNTFGEDCNFNIFQSATNNNNISGTFRNNILGNSFQNNSIDLLFLSNFCAFQFSTNKVGIGAIGNFFKLGSMNNIFDANICNNDNFFLNCKIGSRFNNNTGNIYNSEINGANKCTFPTTTPFDSNVCNNLLCCDFSSYVLNNKLDSVSYLSSTSTFTYNNISYMTRGIFGYWFRMNTIEPNVYNNINADIVFTSATITPNDAFNKRIFKNSSGQPRLSYYNAADQLVVTSPTA